MFTKWQSVVNQTLTAEEREAWVNALKLSEVKFEEYWRELVGIVGWFMLPTERGAALLDDLLLFQAVYELGSPTGNQCSGLLAADREGHVFHGRNMDYSFPFTMPDGSVYNWPEVTYIGKYWKGGQLLFTAPSFLLYTGLHTGMRYGGWTFEQNTRPGNHRGKNLEALQAQGGDLFGWAARRIIENTATFKEAVRAFASRDFMAPMYFILSGPGPFEGAVIARDRSTELLEDTPTLQLLSNETWYLLQTNDDSNKQPKDARRPLTQALLTFQHPEDVDRKFMWKNIRSPTLVGDLTVFTWVADVKTGQTELMTRSEFLAAEKQFQASALDATRLASTGKRVGHTKWARRALLAHEGLDS